MESEPFSSLLLVALVLPFALSHFLVRLNRAIFSIDVSTGGVPAGEGLLNDKSLSASSERESEFPAILPVMAGCEGWYISLRASIGLTAEGPESPDDPISALGSRRFKRQK